MSTSSGERLTEKRTQSTQEKRTGPISGGATFIHPARADDKPPAPDFIRTPGGGWAPAACEETPGYREEIGNQFIIDGRAFPAAVENFPNGALTSCVLM